DEETRVAFQEPRRVAIVFDGGRVHLPDGRSLLQPPGVQDSASQFVQLTWLFTTRPGLLATGRSVEFPLALPRSVQGWTYDVLDHETLYTRFGAVDTLHVKPRREPRPGLEMTAEIWVAPAYQYLPLRILIHQSPTTFVDLTIASLPLQAEPGR
ncbi:MAG: DUF3108 domain-containing protein, partial [Burkholderiales bacterium]|nr:DUF3108 domain-containing protein [Burkholderiales bacterium]